MQLRSARHVAIVLVVIVSALAGSVAGPTSSAFAAVDCSKTFVVGVRGSGETSAQNAGYGPEVWQAITAFDHTFGTSQQSVALDYVAAPVNTKTITDPGYYFESISIGIKKLTDILVSQAARCPSQPLVLFGYSQGALVINRALRSISASVSQRVVATGLIADPARLGGHAYDVGTASSLVNGIGQWSRKYTGDLPAALQPRAVSMCMDKDVVCAFDGPYHLSAVGMAYGIHVHTSYKSDGRATETGTRTALKGTLVLHGWGDIDGDRKIGCRDRAIMYQQWGETGTGLSADLNGDNYVGIGDLSILAAHTFDTATCSSPVGGGSATPQPFVDAFNRWGTSILGSAINSVHQWGPGCVQDFVGGSAGKSALMQANCSGPVYVVQGDQWSFYVAHWRGDPNPAGYPTDDVHRVSAGWTQDFAGASLMKGDHVGHVIAMWGGIAVWYASVGGPASSYGYPMTDEYTWQGTPRRDFEGGPIVWVNGWAYNLVQVGAWAPNQSSYVGEFNAASGYQGMGFPFDYVHAWGTGCTQDYIGGYNTKSAIMSAGCNGAAFRVVGEQWAYLEEHAGASAAQEYGYPYNDVHRYGNGWTQDFSGGNRAWNLLMKGDHVGRVYDVLGGIRDKYLSQGGANGWLGYPTTDEYGWNGYICQGFEGDTICWTADDGARLMNLELTIVDTPSFWGPSQYLTRFTGLGFNGDMWRTFAEGAGHSAVNGAEWVGDISPVGVYRIDVFVPRAHATCVTNYYVRWNGGQSVVAVNQNAYYDRWVTLGTYAINGPRASVGSNDSTGARGCEIGWDAIRWVKVG